MDLPQFKLARLRGPPSFCLCLLVLCLCISCICRTYIACSGRILQHLCVEYPTQSLHHIRHIVHRFGIQGCRSESEYDLTCGLSGRSRDSLSQGLIRGALSVASPGTTVAIGSAVSSIATLFEEDLCLGLDLATQTPQSVSFRSLRKPLFSFSSPCLRSLRLIQSS